MINQAVHCTASHAVEGVLRDELSRGDVSAHTVLPVLRHLVSGQSNSVFSDEILARVRGMLEDLAVSLLGELAKASTSGTDGPVLADDISTLRASLMDNALLLGHLHALALEWQLTERLQERLSIDPVVTPLLQKLIASPDGDLQDLAMRLLAAQARWCQAQRRMRLPLSELPAELLHIALMTLKAHAGATGLPLERVVVAETRIRDRYDEGAGRLGLAAQLILGLGGSADTALSVSSAGLCLFLSALAHFSSQERDAMVAATHENQLARLALSLRAAGLRPRAVEEEFQAFHPDILLPDGFETVTPDGAAAMLFSGQHGA